MRLHVLLDFKGRIDMPAADHSVMKDVAGAVLDVRDNLEPHEFKTVALEVVNLLMKQAYPAYEERID